MFAKFVQASSSKPTTSTIELTLTRQFVEAVVEHGFRLSYAALAQAAKDLGENTSDQKLGQRGSKLVKSLPLTLQPYVCRKNGGYKVGVTWDCEVPGDLRNRPVITEEVVSEAVITWQESLEETE